MNKLISSRKKIEKIDKKIAKLFEKRMLEVENIYEYKKENNIDTLDTNRETYLLNKNINHIKDEKFIPYYQTFQKMVMDVSKEYQNNKKK